MARPRKRRRGRYLVLGLLAAAVAAVVGYRQRALTQNRREFDQLYG